MDRDKDGGKLRISVIIACRNSGETIGRCLESLATQSHQDVEVVVADGASTDGTCDILRRYSGLMDDRLNWLSEPDDGLADAWNKAVRRSTGEWLLFLGADDMLATSDALSRAVPFLSSAFPMYLVIYGKIAMMAADGRIIAHDDWPWSASEFRSCRRALPHQAVFHHRSLFERFGSFDTALSIGTDFDFLLRALMRDEPLHISDLLVSNMQIGGMSTDRRNAPRGTLVQIHLYRRHVGRFPLLLYWWLLKTLAIWALHRLGGDGLALSTTNIYRRIVGNRPPLPY